jgi:1-acyl-sn-glycerol-3-phosphate acyltransferase
MRSVLARLPRRRRIQTDGGQIDMDRWQRVMGFILWPPMKLLYRLRAEGIENLPAGGGYVLASNHLSNFDPWVLAYPLWPRRRLRSMAKAELFNPILTPLLKASGAFPVRRDAVDTEAYRTSVQILRSGQVLLVFPEGARRNKGRWKKNRRVPTPQSGAARIALSAGVPLVPVAIIGTDRLTRLAPVRIAVGPPIELGDLAGRRQRDVAEVATQRLMGELRRLEASLREAVQPGFTSRLLRSARGARQ